VTDVSRCPQCEQRLEHRPLGPREATHGSVAVVVEGAGELVCPEGHHREPASPDVLRSLRDAAGRDILVSQRTRLRRQLRCGVCEAELTVPGRRTTRSVSAPVPDAGVVRATFDLPMLRCPDCGREQVPEEVGRRDLPAALDATMA
jgi:uncharacterized protein with PIN domain